MNMMKRFLIWCLACWTWATIHAQGLSLATAESTVRFLTSDPGAADYWPCFSPDGKVVLFSRSVDGKKSWEFFVVPTAGGDAHRFVRSPLPVSATRADWSIRNNLIAFTGLSANDKSCVWIMNPDGSNLHQLVSSRLSDSVFYPSWYPNVENLAVLDARDSVIKRIDQKQDAAVTVTDRDQVLAGMPSVSPDGEWIAFAGQKNVGKPYEQRKNSIWLLRNDGTMRTLESASAQGRTPHWSPDGHWLAFESNRGSTSGLYAAFIINRDGTGLRQVTNYELNANHPVWSPDGARLVFSGRHKRGQDATGIATVEAVER